METGEEMGAGGGQGGLMRGEAEKEGNRWSTRSSTAGKETQIGRAHV